VDGVVVACEVDAYVAEFAQKCFHESTAGHKISVKVAPALETMKQLAANGEVFDLVFIDADKAGYTDYVDLLLTTGLLAPNGLICADNTLMQGHKISVKVAPALETMKELAENGEVFDLVFIDADKAGYLDYLNLLLTTGLLAPNGLICVDNTLMQGQPYLSGTATPNGVAIAKFNQALVDDPRVEQVLLPLRDGLTLIRRV